MRRILLSQRKSLLWTSRMEMLSTLNLLVRSEECLHDVKAQTDNLGGDNTVY
jgi:hypothetical protein